MFVLKVFSLLICTVAASETSNADSRLVGATNAKAGEFPYQVSLRKASVGHFCGASIISHRWILSAGHCVQSSLSNPSELLAVVGSIYLDKGGTTYPAKQIIQHPEYDAYYKYNDVSVIKTLSCIKFGPTSGVGRIGLATIGRNEMETVGRVGLATTPPASGSTVVISGWGLTSFPSTEIPNGLQKLWLKAISLTECKAALPYPVRDNNICTFTKAGEGTCEGDSGGPLVYNGEQVGVVSFGEPCAVGKPDVYASVAAYRNWIKENTGV